MCRIRCLLSCSKLHLNLKLLGLLSGKWLYSRVVGTLLVRCTAFLWHTLDARTGAGDVSMLLLRVAVDSTGQGLMMPNRLDLTLRDLLDLLHTFTRNILSS